MTLNCYNGQIKSLRIRLHSNNQGDRSFISSYIDRFGQNCTPGLKMTFLVKIVPPGLEIGIFLVKMAPPVLGNLC